MTALRVGFLGDSYRKRLFTRPNQHYFRNPKLAGGQHWSESDDNAIDCEIACDCVNRANVVLGLRKETIDMKHIATHKPTSAQSLI